MVKLLKGQELSLFIKERQAKQVRRLKQSLGVQPKLAILRSSDDPVIDLYIRLKKAYGEDIGVLVEEFSCSNEHLPELIEKLNNNQSTHGIIVQLPLADSIDPGAILNAVKPHKDVDALGKEPNFTPATPLAIQWLLAGQNIEMKDRKIVIVGKGRLVGAPLYELLKSGDHDVESLDLSTEHIEDKIEEADIVISAVGKPGLIKSSMLRNGHTVIDAGTACAAGKIKGDADDAVYDLPDITITAKKGGVGPLTVSALFENLLLAAEKSVH